jgi:large subunit ribosomal protein L19
MATMNAKLSPVDVEKRKKLDIRPGDTVRVWTKVKEKDGKTRLQGFEGMILSRKHGLESGAMFTVRRVASGVGVEKIFPLFSPSIDEVEVIRRAKVRRAKLYYVREKAAKEIKRKMRSELHKMAPEEKEETAVETEAKAE